MLMNMKDLLAVARANDFAVPAFNISSNMLLKGVMEASEELQSPVILAIHPDELSFVTPEFVAYAVEAATKATVPVCIHLDHGANLGQERAESEGGDATVEDEERLKRRAKRQNPEVGERQDPLTLINKASTCCSRPR